MSVAAVAAAHGSSQADGRVALAMDAELNPEDADESNNLQWLVGIKGDLWARLPLYREDWACDRLPKVYLTPTGTQLGSGGRCLQLYDPSGCRWPRLRYTLTLPVSCKPPLSTCCY